MLLVLDNFEQVLDAAPLLADLLERAPRDRAVRREVGLGGEACLLLVRATVSGRGDTVSGGPAAPLHSSARPVS